MTAKMSEITIPVGTIEADNSGRQYDQTREVAFTGVALADVDLPGYHNGNVTDTRGTRETLYKAADGRLIVHVNDWSNWQGEPTTYAVHEVTFATLVRDYPQLAAAAGMGAPLTLDDALARGRDAE